jgi:hypothetical protein
VTGLHAAVVHELASSGQTTAGPLLQEPAWHVSLDVHALWSSHAVPSGLGVRPQPVIGLHTPVPQSVSGQVIGSAPVHVPAWQLELCVQTL